MTDAYDGNGAYDKNGKLTPQGLAEWMDQEGGVTACGCTVIEAGCDFETIVRWEDAQRALEVELRRIGAEL